MENSFNVVSVPLSKIQPNPRNPRRVITPIMVEEMAVSLKSVGLKNPIKLTPLSQDTYQVLSGHIRLAGAQKLGWESISALVLNLTPEEALLEAILDNRGQPMNWLETYMAAESLLELDPKLTQQEVADQLGIERSLVSKSQKLLAVLNPASRDLICEQFTKPADEQITQRAVYTLSTLSDPQMAEEALRVLIDKKMTEFLAKALVAWVQSGQPANTFNQAKTPKTTAKTKTTPQTNIHLVPASDPLTGSTPPVGSKAAASANATAEGLPTDAKAHHEKPLAHPNHMAQPESDQPGPASQTEALKQLAGQAKEGFEFLKSTGVLQGLKKLAQWFAKIGWRGLVKYEHHMVKSMTNYMVPVKQFSASGHKHHGTPFTPVTALAMVLHWFVYTLLQLTLGWLILTWLASRFLPFLKPWVKWPFQGLAYLLFHALPQAVWPWALNNVAPAVVLGLLLFIGISMAYKAQPQRMFFMTVLLAALWYYGRGFSEPASLLTLAPSPSTVQTPVPPAPAQLPAVAQAAPAQPAPAAPLAAPVPKKITVASVPTAANTPIPTQTPTKKSDVASDVLKVAPAGVDVAKKLFGL